MTLLNNLTDPLTIIKIYAQTDSRHIEWGAMLSRLFKCTWIYPLLWCAAVYLQNRGRGHEILQQNDNRYDTKGFL